MESEKKENFDLRELFPDEEQRRIFAKVFDRSVVEAVHALASKGYFDVLEFVISTGKEAHVFRASDRSGNFKAVKIYKIETSGYKNMIKYVEGDIRFNGVKNNKRDLVYAWTRKEFRNLTELDKAGIRVPLPIAFQKNVLVMEFIGEKGQASPALKDSPLEDKEKLHSSIVEFMAKAFFRAELIHADLSEYNILNKGGELVLIDCGQTVPTTHPDAKSFFERDVANISNYLAKNGIKRTPEELTEDIRAKKAEFKK